MKTSNQTRERILAVICFMLLSITGAFAYNSPLPAVQRVSNDKTPFGIFRNLWMSQGNDTDGFSLFTPVPDETLAKISPELQKKLKVKNEVNFGSGNTVSSVLTKLLKEKYGKKANAKNDFLAIQYSTSPDDFANYLQKYPDSKYAEEAKAKQGCLQAREQWIAVKKKGTRKAIEEYANSYGQHLKCDYDGFDIINAENNKNTRSIRDWYQLADQSDGNDPSIYKKFDQYINRYGEDAYFAEAARDSMKLNLDRYDWNQATKTDTPEAYNNYLKDHENGRFSKRAQAVLTEIDIWKKAKASDNYESYCAYYTEYPDGRYATEAIKKIKAIEDPIWQKVKEDIEENRERLKELNRMLNDVEPSSIDIDVSMADIVSYEKFLEEHPSGFYANEARKRIADLRLAPYLKEKPSFDSFPCVGDYSHPGYSLICIGNGDKSKTITVSLTGPTGYSKKLQHGQYEWVRVKNGSYKILVQASAVQNWWGNATFENSLYANAWSTVETRNGIPIHENKDEEASKRIVNAVMEKVQEERIKTLQYIYGISE